MSDAPPPYQVPADDDPIYQDPLLQAPTTNDPWVLIEWMVKLTTEQRMLFLDSLLTLVKKRPPVEQQVLLHTMKTRLNLPLMACREQLRLMKENDITFAVLTHYEGTDDKGRAYLAEMIYRPEDEVRWGFLVYFFDSGGRPEFYEKLNTATGLEIRPMIAKLIMSGAVLVPSGYEEYGDDATLFAALRTFINKYVQAGDDDQAVLDLAAAYVMYSYLQDRFPIACYYRALGDYAAGKSTLLRTLGHVVYRAVFCGGTATAAPIFRIMEKVHGTLILDEADFDMRDQEWKQILKILNQGWTKGAPVLRAEKATEGSPFDVVDYDPFGSKVLASRRAFPDPALESRCLGHTMVPPIQLRPDIPLFADAAFYQEANSLRNQLLLWRFRNYKTVVVDPRERIDGVEPRLTANAIILLSAISDPRVRANLEVLFRSMSEEHRQERHDSYEGLVAQAVIVTWLRLKRPVDHFKLDVATEEMSRLQGKPITGKKMGNLVRRVLGLTLRPIGGHTQIVSPPDQMAALAKRYAITLEGYQPSPADAPRVPRTPVR